MKKVLSHLLVVAAILSSCQDTSDEYSTEKLPNIVFVLADDLGVPQVGCYGSDFYQTPNIDRLAANGIKFTNAYAAASICSPTRSALMTGKNPARTHITNFIPGDPSLDSTLSQPEWQKCLPLKEVTIGEMLKKQGYKTALFGKWHLSKNKRPPLSLSHNPDKQGFDEHFVTYKPWKKDPSRSWQTAEEDAHNVDTLTNLAIDFIRRNKDSTFFLMVSHNTIHDPIMERSNAIERYAELPNANQPENNATLAAMVERMDEGFGRLYKTLEDLALVENTLIIFYSDNGAKDAYAAQTPFRQGKGWLYEGGIRVPLIMQWEGNLEKNTTSKALVTTMDFFPTLANVAGGSSETALDGLDILSGGKYGTSRDLFWNYPHYHRGSGMKPAAAIRSGDFKLIQWYEPMLQLDSVSAFELYDLGADIGERENLSQQMPEKLKEMKDKLAEIKQDMGAQEPYLR